MTKEKLGISFKFWWLPTAAFIFMLVAGIYSNLVDVPNVDAAYNKIKNPDYFDTYLLNQFHFTESILIPMSALPGVVAVLTFFIIDDRKLIYK